MSVARSLKIVVIMHRPLFKDYNGTQLDATTDKGGRYNAMGTYVVTLSVSSAFREAHFQALKSSAPLTEDIAASAEAHLRYVRDLKAKGKVLAAGPTVAFSWALMLLKADSLEAARALVENDPGIKSGLFADPKIETWYHMA